MEKFMEIHAEYHSIMASYCGSETDWQEAYNKLRALEAKCKKVKVRDGKNYYFYTWLKRTLYKEITEEASRILGILRIKLEANNKA